VNVNALHIEFELFSLDATPGWRDITAEIGVENPPITLARDDGVGALQFTVGLYRAGSKPNPTSADLVSMIHEFGSAHNLGKPIDERVEKSPRLTLAAASFRVRGDFIRTWYLTDGKSFAKITYTCDDDDTKVELGDCEQIVRSLRFKSR
jgi:hypothetical protein